MARVLLEVKKLAQEVHDATNAYLFFIRQA
jgi:hypothetical protein